LNQLGSGEVLPSEFKHYDIKQNLANEKFLGSIFTQAASILPIQNLGELAFIMQKQKAAFTLLDMCLKLYKVIDG
jgi:hypothetical protein